MSLPFKAISFRKGETPPRIRFRLLSQNVRSGAVRARPDIGDVVTLTMQWPNGDKAYTSTADGGLVVDPVSRVASLQISDDEVAKMTAGKAVGLVVSLTNADGIKRHYALGSLTMLSDRP